MKKFRLFLMCFAFVGAGIGVFATTLNEDDAFTQSYRISVNLPCDTPVANENCSVGEEICAVSSGPNIDEQIHLFDSDTQECEPLFKP